MLSKLKYITHCLFHSFGFDIVRYPEAVSVEPPSVLSYDSRRHCWMQELGVTLLLDVGANVGQYAESMRKQGYTKRIVSFEPLSEAFAELERRSSDDPDWECRNSALGASDETSEIYIAGNSQSSSLLVMNQRHVDAAP